MNETMLRALSNSEFLRIHQDSVTTDLERMLMDRMRDMLDEIEALESAGFDDEE